MPTENNIQDSKHSEYENRISSCLKNFFRQKNLILFFGEKTDIDALNGNYISKFRSELQEKLNISANECLQVIGDSNPFSDLGHIEASQILDNLIKQHKGPILYGFTSNNNGGANGVVNTFIEKNPKEVYRVIANLVWKESITAIEKWRCTYSKKINCFIVVFDKDENECHFGDDIALSDSLSENLVCFEGGVISFCQIVNTLVYHDEPNIKLFYGLRKVEEDPYFSAAEFFLKAKKADSIEDLEKIKNSYLRKNKLDQKKQIQFNAGFDLLIKKIHVKGFDFLKQIETKNIENNIKLDVPCCSNYSASLYRSKQTTKESENNTEQMNACMKKFLC